MSANVETMFYVREAPWHGLGVRVESALNSEEALVMSGLNWNVIQRPIMTSSYTPIPGYKANIRDTDKFLGMRTDITELMASADYMIMPSLHEGFPVVLVESQTVGLKALVSDQVSPEVDLELGLVQFLPIHLAKDWVECLLASKQSKPHEKDITAALNLYGFSAANNAQQLMQKYLNM